MNSNSKDIKITEAKSKRRKWAADGILACSVLCCLGSAPFMDQYIWANGLFHMSFASSVGGFADWFAVRSLFGKPLKVGIRTNLISRHRDEIETMLQEFTTTTLLNQEWLVSFFASSHPSEWIRSIWKHHDQELVKAGESLLIRVFHSEEFRNMLLAIKKKGLHEAYDIDWGRLFGEEIQKNQTNFFRSFIAPFLSEEGERFYQNPELRHMMETIVHLFWNQYKENSLSRRIFHFLADRDEQKSMEAMMDGWQKVARDLKDPESVIYQKAEGEWNDWVRSFAEDDEKRKRFGHWFGVKLFQFLNQKMGGFTHHPEKEQELAHSVSLYINQYMETKLESEEMKDRIDRWGRNALIQHVDFFQKALISLIHTALIPYDKDKLSKLAEEKAGSEIEAIRVNGSLFGGGLGLLFFVLSEATGIL